jgi:glycosyltransferase involved in cell wall biosynthesis
MDTARSAVHGGGQISVIAEEPDLSVVVLCYRAGDSIREVIEPLEDLLEDSAISYELVLVANYPPDRPDPTVEVVRRFASSRELVTVVAEEKKGAMGWDMRSGLAATAGAYLVAIDGDAQNPVEDVLRMYELLRRTGADLGKGRRTNRADGVYRRFISWGYNFLFRLLFRTGPVWDVNGKPKGLRRAAYEQMQLESNDWFIDAEMVLKARRDEMTVVELPVVFLENKDRSSFVRVSSIWEFLAHMARYRLLGRL